MRGTSVTESVVEDTALTWPESLGYTVRHGLDIAKGEVSSAQAGYDSEGSTGRCLTKQHQDALR